MRAIAVVALLSTGCVSFLTMKDTPTFRSDAKCNASYAPAIIDTAAAAAALTYTIVTIAGYKSDEECVGSGCSKSNLGQMVGMGLVSGVITGSAVYGWRSASQCRAAPAHETLPERPEPLALPQRETALPLDTPLVETVPARDPAAADKTRESHRAALIGDCTSTRAVAVEVKELDPSYYVHVFLNDEAIVRCLRATPGPAIP